MAKNKKEDTEIKIKKIKNKPAKKNKKIKNASIKNETVIIANSDEDAKELIKKMTETPVAETQNERKRNFWSEVKALFGIVLIIGLIVLIGYLVYKYVEPVERKPKEESKVVETNQYKFVTYITEEDRQLEVIDNKYVIETKDNILYKVLDMDSTVIFEGKEKYSNIYIGTDGELYIVCYGSMTGASYDIGLYRIESNELEEVVLLTGIHNNYTEILYKDNNDNTKLMGILAEDYIEDADFSITSIVYLLDGSKKEYPKTEFKGDTVRISNDIPVYSYNPERVIILDGQNESKAGVLDIITGEMIINSRYDGLYTTRDGNYIAIKNKKTGVINEKSKILINFDYDFISDNKDFYVVSQNQKLGIINSKYEEIIKPTFTFQESTGSGFAYYLCCGNVNSFSATKYQDKYILTINNDELYYNIDYKLHETYVIGETGEYITIEANEFGVYDTLLYSYDKEDKKYTIYDETFAEKYIIDLSNYDFDINPSLTYIHDNTIIIYMGSTLYFDSTTGVELEETHDALISDDKFEIKYSGTQKKVTWKVNGETISTFEYKEPSEKGFYVKLDNGIYYYANNNKYVMIRKSE